MSVEETIREYYEALRQGEPLEPYFLEDEGAVKFGVSEALYGFEDVADGLREQRRSTDDWTVESERLTVTERDGYAWFGDEVELAWTDRESGERWAFDTRWSGTLEAQRAPGGDGKNERWLFATMHVSAPREL